MSKEMEREVAVHTPEDLTLIDTSYPLKVEFNGTYEEQRASLQEFLRCIPGNVTIERGIAAVRTALFEDRGIDLLEDEHGFTLNIPRGLLYKVRKEERSSHDADWNVSQGRSAVLFGIADHSSSPRVLKTDRIARITGEDGKKVWRNPNLPQESE